MKHRSRRYCEARHLAHNKWICCVGKVMHIKAKYPVEKVEIIMDETKGRQSKEAFLRRCGDKSDIAEPDIGPDEDEEVFADIWARRAYRERTGPQ